jgi:hypothetical protein
VVRWPRRIKLFIEVRGWAANFREELSSDRSKISSNDMLLDMGSLYAVRLFPCTASVFVSLACTAAALRGCPSCFPSM